MKNLVIANYRSGGFTLHDMLLEKYNCYTFREIFFNVDDIQNKLKEYNDNNAYMGLVLFEDAIKHVCKITRIV